MEKVVFLLNFPHLFFFEIEKPGGLLCFLDTCCGCHFLAVRPSRHSRNGRFAVQRGRRRTAVRALLQPDKALSAFFTCRFFGVMLLTRWLSVLPVLMQNRVFSGCRRQKSILRRTTKCFVKKIRKLMKFMYCMFFYAFALLGRWVSMFDSRGAASLCPGLCACCLFKARRIHPISVLWM